MTQHKPIAELPNYIVLDQYTEIAECGPQPTGYQSEAALEKELIKDLSHQGFAYVPSISGPTALLANARAQLQKLNNVQFTDKEWNRFVAEYLDPAGDTMVDKTRKVQDNYIYDFTFDDGHLQNIYLVDKKNLARNQVQVINQFEQTGTADNRYDVTLLVNGLPMVQIELKKRGVPIREAFNQIHRYSKESFNSESPLYKYLQLFVISNGTDTRYFANTIKRDKNSFDFTINWATADNTAIKDLKDFTATFFQKNTLLHVLLTYSVFDVENTLLIMRPYQIAATERLIWKIRSSYQAKRCSCPEAGGYIWHTTGSGKTLTSFKAARIATALPFIDKVFFVVDRKDLDYQTMKEYQRFSKDSVNGSENTAGLLRNIEKDDNKIIVTTIQKLNNLIKSNSQLPIYKKQVVFIFDECHRSQFGEAQKNITKNFKHYYQFGFTGTPIFRENSLDGTTTASVFGSQLHSYVITDAIRDNKVLKFNVDYNNVRPTFRKCEAPEDEEEITASEINQQLLHPDRIKAVSQYILDNFRIKTHRNQGKGKGFNAMFAVSSVDAAKMYYETLNALQQTAPGYQRLKIATIYSYAPNEEQNAIGEIKEENFEVSAMESSAKEFLTKAIADYNKMFGTNFGVDSTEFQNYYRDLAKRVKKQQVDLVIVVGMFLTGFDAPTLNTLFVDKNLRYHGLIQAFSRTNRILDATKTFGNIVTFRDLEKATIDAITLFGDTNTKNIILEKSYKEYLNGYTDALTNEVRKGYIEIVSTLKEQYPEPQKIDSESDKKAFVKLFGEYLKIENILQNYDEFTHLKEFQKIDQQDEAAVTEFMNTRFLTPEEIETIKKLDVLPERVVQDYRSTYHDIRQWLIDQRKGKKAEKLTVDWSDVVFEVELLKSQEIDLDYILELLFEHTKNTEDKAALIQVARRIIRSSAGNRAKEGLIVDFISATDLSAIKDRAEMIEAFYTYAQKKQKEEADQLIAEEKLNDKEARYYIQTSLERKFATKNGTDLNAILPKMSPLHPQYLTRKKSIYQRISNFIDKFKGIGGSI